MRRRFQMAHMIDDTFMIFDADTGYILKYGMSKEAAVSLYLSLAEELPAKVTVKDFTREDVEKIYVEYPRKLGKKSGVDFLYRTLKNASEVSECLSACKNYALRCISESIDEQYIKHFSTWVKRWRDDLPEDDAHAHTQDADTLTFL